MGLLDEDGVHHFIVNFWDAARATQEAILDSWSMDDMINSESGGKSRAWERFRKFWVVLEPRTR